MGDIEANLAKISQLYAASEAAGCDIVMFPELSITGYPPEDLVLKAGFVAANQEALASFARTTGTCDCGETFQRFGNGVTRVRLKPETRVSGS